MLPFCALPWSTWIIIKQSSGSGFELCQCRKDPPCSQPIDNIWEMYIVIYRYSEVNKDFNSNWLSWEFLWAFGYLFGTKRLKMIKIPFLLTDKMTCQEPKKMKMSQLYTRGRGADQKFSSQPMISKLEIGKGLGGFGSSNFGKCLKRVFKGIPFINMVIRLWIKI